MPDFYPRPLLKRESFCSLNGTWDFAFSEERHLRNVHFDRKIQVPYAPETPRSGIHDMGFHPSLWYRRTVPLEGFLPGPDERLILHFGAADETAHVYLNGHPIGTHEGGYTPFSFDITEQVQENPTGDLVLAVHVLDDPQDLHLPRGKQDWQETPHAIWYPRTSGLWQTVWLEKVPELHIQNVRWTPDVSRFTLTVRVEFSARVDGELHLEIEDLISDTCRVQGQVLERTLHFPDPGIDDLRDDLLWSPEHPRLLHATLTLKAGGQTDRVTSYTAMRQFGARGRRFMLNGRPYPLRLVLDQGIWREGGLTASSAELREDVELARRLGFNGVRKHQKIESPEFLRWCDEIGLLVWEELPSHYAFSEKAVHKALHTWREVIHRDVSHPCIVVWVPFNESWGLPELAENPATRHYQHTLYHLTHTLDGTRPVSANDGWEQVTGDLYTLHDYDPSPEKLFERYHSPESIEQTHWQLWPGGRQQRLEGFEPGQKPVILSEFGGILCSPSEGGWGYTSASTPEDFQSQYHLLLTALRKTIDLKGLHGFCYTQLTDTYQEQNGLLTMDRKPKFPLEAAHQSTRGEFDSKNPLGYARRWLMGQEKGKTQQ